MLRQEIVELAVDAHSSRVDVEHSLALLLPERGEGRHEIAQETLPTLLQHECDRLVLFWLLQEAYILIGCPTQ